MNKKFKALSTMGYMIALVIIAGIVMIICTPLMVENTKESKQQQMQQEYLNNNIAQPSVSEIEEKFNKKLLSLDAKILDTQKYIDRSVSNKYVCTIEGKVNDKGDIVPIDQVTENKKFVFVCEYRN